MAASPDKSIALRLFNALKEALSWHSVRQIKKPLSYWGFHMFCLTFALNMWETPHIWVDYVCFVGTYFLCNCSVIRQLNHNATPSLSCFVWESQPLCTQNVPRKFEWCKRVSFQLIIGKTCLMRGNIYSSTQAPHLIFKPRVLILRRRIYKLDLY